VILEAVNAEDGSVQNVRVLRSPPLLEQARGRCSPSVEVHGPRC
jgi:hypothetical protein